MFLVIKIQVEPEHGIQMPELEDFGSVERARAPVATPSPGSVAGAEVTPDVAMAGKQNNELKIQSTFFQYIIQPYHAKPWQQEACKAATWTHC